MTVHNPGTQEHPDIGTFLDDLYAERVELFDGEILGKKYKGRIIKRYDRILNNSVTQSY